MGNQVTKSMSWINHNGKGILFANYESLEGPDFAGAIRENEDAIVAMGRQGRSDLLILTDITNALIDQQAIEAFKSVTENMRPYTLKSAVVGISGVRKFALDIVNRFSKLETKSFNDLDQAKDWLVS